MLHAECLTVDPDHFNRNTEALPQAHRKSLCHMDIRSLHDQWLRFQATRSPRDLPKTMFLRAAHATYSRPLAGPRPRPRSLGPAEHLGMFARYMCCLASDLGRRVPGDDFTRATCQRPLARSRSECCQPGLPGLQCNTCGISPLRSRAYRSLQRPPKLERHTFCVKIF